jgi:hypothetical protein
VVMPSMMIVAGTKPEKDDADTGRLTVGVVVRAAPGASLADNRWSGARGVVGRTGVIDRGGAGEGWDGGGANGVMGCTDGVWELTWVGCDDECAEEEELALNSGTA